MMDSDGDGFSNGEELGDPKCMVRTTYSPTTLAVQPSDTYCTAPQYIHAV